MLRIAGTNALIFTVEENDDIVTRETSFCAVSGELSNGGRWAGNI